MAALTIFKNFSSRWSFHNKEPEIIITSSAATNKNIENESIVSCVVANQINTWKYTNKRIKKIVLPTMA